MAAALGPEGVARWLGSMWHIIPNQVLSGLRESVVSRQVDGVKFSEVVNDGLLHELCTEHLSMVHLSHIRRAWHADHPVSRTFRRDGVLRTTSPEVNDGAGSLSAPATPRQSPRPGCNVMAQTVLSSEQSSPRNRQPEQPGPCHTPPPPDRCAPNAVSILAHGGPDLNCGSWEGRDSDDLDGQYSSAAGQAHPSADAQRRFSQGQQQQPRQRELQHRQPPQHVPQQPQQDWQCEQECDQEPVPLQWQQQPPQQQQRLQRPPTPVATHTGFADTTGPPPSSHHAPSTPEAVRRLSAFGQVAVAPVGCPPPPHAPPSWACQYLYGFPQPAQPPPFQSYCSYGTQAAPWWQPPAPPLAHYPPACSSRAFGANPTPLIATTVDFLARWAGFDLRAAITGLRDVLPQQLCDELTAMLGSSLLASRSPGTQRAQREPMEKLPTQWESLESQPLWERTECSFPEHDQLAAPALSSAQRSAGAVSSAAAFAAARRTSELIATSMALPCNPSNASLRSMPAAAYAARRTSELMAASMALPCSPSNVSLPSQAGHGAFFPQGRDTAAAAEADASTSAFVKDAPRPDVQPLSARSEPGPPRAGRPAVVHDRDTTSYPFAHSRSLTRGSVTDSPRPKSRGSVTEATSPRSSFRTQLGRPSLTPKAKASARRQSKLAAQSQKRGPDASFVAAWVSDLPPSLLPDQQRQELAAAVRSEALDGDGFSKIVADSSALANRGVASPARGIKLRRAWESVLREEECRRVAAESLQGAAQKAVKMTV